MMPVLPQVLIFAEKKADVDAIHEYLLLKGVEAVAIHGGKGQRGYQRGLGRGVALPDPAPAGVVHGHGRSQSAAVCDGVREGCRSVRSKRHVVCSRHKRSASPYGT